MRWAIVALLALGACNPDPGEVDQQVGYRDVYDDGPTSGERGNIVISEMLWSGSVIRNGDGFDWDPTDVFIELRNEGNLPVRITDWHLIQEGTVEKTWRIPESVHGPDWVIEVGSHIYIAAKTSGCFPEPDFVIPGLSYPLGDPFRMTLRDADERLIEPSGSKTMEPFAGGYDLVLSRSMERIELMFGGRGTEPHMWHHYTKTPVDVPNDDRVLEACRERTLASPGRPNSPDYSGAHASGGFE